MESPYQDNDKTLLAFLVTLVALTGMTISVFVWGFWFLLE